MSSVLSNRDTGRSRFHRPDNAKSQTRLPANTDSVKALTTMELTLDNLDSFGIFNNNPIKGLRSQVPKSANTLVTRDRQKKFGHRKPYSVKMLMSIRSKCRMIPEGVEEIEGVFQEGIGEQTGTTYIETTKTRETSKKRPISLNSSAAANHLQAREDSNQRAPQRNTKNNNKKELPSKKPSTENTKPTIITKTKTPKIQTPPQQQPQATTTTTTTTTATTTTTKTITTASEKQPTKSSTENSSSLEEFEPLAKSKKAWGRKSKKTKEEKLLGTVKGVLNKITFEKFDTLAKLLVDFIEKKVKTKKDLSLVVSELFAKTVKETHFGPLYADLCLQLSSTQLSFHDESTKEDVTFKRVLVNQCQKEFERGFTTHQVNSNLTPEEKEELEDEEKKLAMGTVQFIGQLYNKGLLPEKICKVCLNTLITDNPKDLSVQCANKLLETIGEKYDSTPNGKKHLDAIFLTLRNNKRNLSSNLTKRTKILVDILEHTRRSGWKDNKSADKAKTLAEIHEEFVAVKGHVSIKSGRQPNFDESWANMFGRYSKNLAFANKGGVALRSRNTASTSTKTPTITTLEPKLFGNLLLSSSQIVDDSLTTMDEPEDDDYEGETVDDGDSVKPYTKDEAEKHRSSFIRTYLTALEDEKAKAAAPNKLFKTIQKLMKVVFANKAKVIDHFLMFITFDANEGSERVLCGRIIVNLFEENKFFTKQDVIDCYDEYCEYYTANEGDAPKQNEYFAAFTAQLVAANLINLSQVNKSLKKDPTISKPKKRNPHKFGRLADILAYFVKQKELKNTTYIAKDWGIEDVDSWTKHYEKLQV